MPPIDDEQAPGGPVAREGAGGPVCPWCGETLTRVDADGDGLCQVDGVRVWVPPRLR